MGRLDFLDDPNAPQPNSLVPAVNVIVTNAEGRILLIRRTDNDLYASPGGTMEFGESLPDAAVRETREETGLDVEITGFVGTYTHPGHVIAYPDGEVRQEFAIVLTARPVGGQLRTSSESSQVVWVDPDSLDLYPMHPRTRLRIDHFLQQHTPHLG